MNRHHQHSELREHDQAILDMIEHVLTNPDSAVADPQSLPGFCAHLAHITPSVDPVFANQLEAQVIGQAQRFNPHLKARRSVPTASLHTPSVRRPGVRWVMGGLMIALLLLGFTPPVRSTIVLAADIVRNLVGVSYQPGSPIMFTPAPPFVVYQPRYLPPGLDLTAQRYAPGGDPQTGQLLPNIEAVGASQSATTPPAVGPSLPPTPTSTVPHVLLEYTAQDGRAVRLMERQVQASDPPPSGEARIFGKRSGTFTQYGQYAMLTWVEQGTRIELQATVSEQELMRIAESFVATQEPRHAQPSHVVNGGELDGGAPTPSPVLPLLGTIPGERFHGRVVFATDESGNYGLSTYSSEGTEDRTVLAAAVAALKDRLVPMQQTDYTEAQNAPTAAYVLVEVWDQHSTIATTSARSDIREQAVMGIEAFLAQVP